MGCLTDMRNVPGFIAGFPGGGDQVDAKTFVDQKRRRANATGLPAARQLGNWRHMGNIAGRDHTSTNWWVRLEQGSSRSRVPRNRVPHSREQSPKPHRGTQAQDRGRERLRFHRSNLHNLLLGGNTGQMKVPQTILEEP